MSDSPAGSAGPRPLLSLLCTVLRPSEGGGEAGAGITATASRVVLTDPGGGHAHLRSAAPAADPTHPGYAPELQLRERRGFLIACPPDAGPRGDPYSFGGNWLWSADGRFPEPAPIAVHDRHPCPEEVRPGIARHAVTNLPLAPPAPAEVGLTIRRQAPSGGRGGRNAPW